MDKLNYHSLLVLALPHALARTHDLVDEQQLLGEGGRDVQPLLLGTVVVVDLLLDGRDSAQRLDV